MKRGWLKYLLLGLWAYVMALLITLPAQQVYGLATQKLGRGQPVTLYDLDGSVWHGRAGTLAWRSMSLGALEWELSPLRMLRGQLAVQLALQNADNTVSGNVLVDYDGGATINDIEGHLTAAQLMRFNPGLPIAADGNVTVNLPKVELPKDAAPIAEGTVVWSQALLVAGQALKLGDLRLTLQPGEGGGTHGDIADSGSGPLELKGTLTLEANRNYRLDAQLRARPGADAALSSSLALLGKADGRGYYTLRYSGRL